MEREWWVIVARIDPNTKLLKGITKERFVVSQIRKWLREYPIIMLSGPRKVGKTTALLQLAVESANVGAEYLNCAYEADIRRLDELIVRDFSGLLLIDEFQMLDDPNSYMHTFTNIGGQDRNFKVVITGSVVAYTRYIAQMKGGGRNKLLHVPLLTYLEYLYFTEKIPNYTIDLSRFDYGDSFIDYMTLKNLHGFMLPLIDVEYTIDAAIEINIARRVSPYLISLLNSNEDDIQRALLLLAHRLTYMWNYRKTFYDPLIGNREISNTSISNSLRNMNVFANFSVWKATHPFMTGSQIEESLRYILWSDLAFCNFVERDINSKLDDSFLSGLYLGKPLYEDELQKLFSNVVQVYITNPLWYSVIAEELWILLEDSVLVPNNVEKPVFRKLANLLKNRNSFLRDPNLMGNWVEAYLRGAYALLCFTPMKTTSFQNETGREIDIARGFPKNLLIEVAIKTEEKKEKDVNFHLAYTGNERCFLTTQNTLDKVVWNKVPICRIPYSMLAAFLDRGEIPDEKILLDVCSSRINCL